MFWTWSSERSQPQLLSSSSDCEHEPNMENVHATGIASPKRTTRCRTETFLCLGCKGEGDQTTRVLPDQKTPLKKGEGGEVIGRRARNQQLRRVYECAMMELGRRQHRRHCSSADVVVMVVVMMVRVRVRVRVVLLLPLLVVARSKHV